MERYEGDNETILGYCSYCKEIVREGENHIFLNGQYYHYDPFNSANNCYFPEYNDIDTYDIDDDYYGE